MKLLNVVRARTTWLFDMAELNPKGKSIFPEFLEWVKDSYNFTKAPSSVTDLDESKALAFTGGSFQIKEEFFIDVDLRIYNDGLVADTKSSTEDSEAFLKDILESAATEFKLTYSPDLVKRIIYVSELNVTSPYNLEGINPKLSAVANEITSKLSSLGVPHFQLSSLSFWPDQIIPSPVSQFRLERKLNVPFSHDRYYSVAPLPTIDHLKLLDAIEKIISAKD